MGHGVKSLATIFRMYANIAGADVPTPPSGYVNLFTEITTKHLSQKDNIGTIIDLTATGGEAPAAYRDYILGDPGSDPDIGRVRLYFDTDGILRSLDSSGASVAISSAPYYGVSWDEVADSYTRTGALAGIATGASPSAFMPIQESMKRCILDDSGNVLYFLDPNDSTLKANGQPATITDQSHGQVMVQIPKFWYKYGYSGTTHTWEISPQPLNGFTVHPAFIRDGAEVDFRYVGAYEASLYDDSASAMVPSGSIATSLYAAGDKLCSISGQYPKTNETRAENRGAASQRGAGWRMMDFDLMSAVQLLYLVEYADFNSQSMIGNGRTTLSGGGWTAGSYIGIAGLSNGDGNGSNAVQSGALGDTDYMTYRGIENFFGNIWNFIDGVNIYNNEAGAYSRLFACNNEANFADDTQVNYEAVGDLVLLDGYQSTLAQVMRGFLPLTVGATSSTKITDYFYTYYDNLGSGWTEDYRVLLLGGYAADGSTAGVFYVHADGASSYDGVHFGGRLCF